MMNAETFPALLVITAMLVAIGLPLVSRLCTLIGLIDRPADHKIVEHPVPLSGGLSILLAASLVLWFTDDMAAHVWAITGLWSLALLGLLDDRFHLPAMLRCIAQLGLIFLFVVWLGDIRVYGIGEIFSSERVTFSPLGSYLFTTVCIVALINAFNMLDGLDGLAGTLFVIMAIALWVITPDAAASEYWTYFAVFTGGVMGFLVHNLRTPWTPKARAYLGDTGSMTLSLVLAMLAIWATQPAVATPDSPSPILAVWILALPIMELGASTVRRLFSKRNVMSADRGHIHHRLEEIGLRLPFIILVICGLAVTLIVAGIILHHQGITDAASFNICFSFFLIYVALLSLPLRRNYETPQQDLPAAQKKGI